jgi:(E)-4-hydroxy-3-methylbut-2-enyl-diphosphate synthase
LNNLGDIFAFAFAGAPAAAYMPSMSIRPWRDIERRKSRRIMVGSVPVGGGAPISVQTMTNTPTEDAKATIDQIRRCEEAGADIVRVSCPTSAATASLKQIVREANVPIVADIHFHYKRALEAADAGAACLRINPGNIGSAERVKEVISAARANGCSMRIGVNAGSLEKDLLEKYGEPCPEALVESALDHIRILEDHGFREYKVAVKASDVFLAVAAYMQLANEVDCPLHLGITEAGGLIGGTVKSAIGMGNLLWAGIGDTIRVSLSAEPEEEVRVGYEILKALGIRNRGVRVVSCPSCARQGFDVIRTVQALEERLQHIRTPMSLSVLGCVVNGPGEARETDIGITGGGHGTHMVYLSGVTDHHVKDADMIDHIVKLVEAKAAEIEAAQAVETTLDAAE